MLAEDLVLVDAYSLLWTSVQPLLEAALQLQQGDDNYILHGWQKKQVDEFLSGLPTHCTLIAGVWDVALNEDGEEDGERLALCCICEVLAGQICSLRTGESLIDENLPPITALEPGFEDARLLMYSAKEHIAPVAWAIFTDKDTWDEWVFSPGDEDQVVDKGEYLASLTRQGRCVLMGSQVAHNHH